MGGELSKLARAALDGPAGPPAALAATRWWFLRLLGLVCLVAIGSLWVQAMGLFGSEGILPVDARFERVAAYFEQQGGSAFWNQPSLLWGAHSDAAIHMWCGLAALAALCVFADLAPAPALLAFWALYLSLCYAGGVFFAFQWDTLLLETTLLAAACAPVRGPPRWRRKLREGAAHTAPPRTSWGMFGLRLLLAKLLLLSALVKYWSHDPLWWSLSALDVHFWTQPLPGPLAPLAHFAPESLRRAGEAFMWVVELGVPVLVLMPYRWARGAAFVGTLALMAGIAVTGNYGFFNLLTAVLAFAALDDAMLPAWACRVAGAPRAELSEEATGAPAPQTPAPEARAPEELAPEDPALEDPALEDPALEDPAHTAGFDAKSAALRRATLLRALAATGAGALAFLSLLGGIERADRNGRLPAALFAPRTVVAPLRSFNGYGLFANMTDDRHEVAVEVRDANGDWRELDFRYKPDRTDEAMPMVQPHMPRLDWQWWFAALRADCENSGWTIEFAGAVLQGSEAVERLLAPGTYDASAPPERLRMLRYDYRFADPAAGSSDSWERRYISSFCPEVVWRDGRVRRAPDPAPLPSP